MLQKAEDIALLLWKHLNGDLLPSERIALDEWVNYSEANRKLLERLENPDRLSQKFKNFNELWELYGQSLDEKFEKAWPANVVPIHPKRRNLIRWVAAAAIIIIASFGINLWQNNKQSPIATTDKKPQPTPQEIMPAKGFAILVLEGGRKLVLDSAGNGVIASNGGKDIINQDGQLSYMGSSKEVVYNTLVTSRGKMMHLLLPDNSRVWLNAESTIKFPTEFADDKRLIEITGEAYFEVAKNEKKPFIVSVRGMAVQVYGTSFNIYAYPEEVSMKTTLIEGKVSVKSGNKSVTIKPGQQAQVDGESINIAENADQESVVAWKNGMTVLNRADMTTLLNTITRWYDVEVEVKGDLGSHVFLGSMPRSLSLQGVVKVLANITNLKFKIDGRKLTVSQ